MDARRLVFLDESCAKTNMTPLRGRVRTGRRLYDATPCGNWHTTTLISSIRLDGTTAMMVLEGSADGDAFRTYIEEFLVPTLRPGDVVVMDNLSTHKVSGVVDSIEAVGAKVWYLPPYSPDLNPIEKMWSKIKTLLRKSKARTTETLWEAICSAKAAVSQQDAQGWFTSCGYGHEAC